MNKGFVTIMGAGPGDPGLITVKGQQRLRSCDAVVYDYLASEPLLSTLKDGCKKFYVGKRAGICSSTQEEINRTLIMLAKAGHRVVRLKGGDPFVFGRGGEEAIALSEEKIPYEVIPGVTSAVAVPECAGIPVTHRGVSRSFHVFAGYTEEKGGGLPVEFDFLPELPGTLVLLMGLNRLPLIVKRLCEAGRSRHLPIAVIEKGTMPGQKIVRGCLEDIVKRVEEAQMQTPAVIVAGDVACMDLSCVGYGFPDNAGEHGFELQAVGSLPLEGILIGITGTPAFRKKLSILLEHMGAETECAGSLEIVSFATNRDVQLVYKNLAEYTMIVFTSVNGVRLFFSELLNAGKDFRTIGHMRLAAVGKGTADELKNHGFLVDFIPETFNTRELALYLAGKTGHEEQILIPRAQGGTPELVDVLRKSGVRVKECILYKVMGSIEADKSLRNRKPDYITFASASGVSTYFENKGSLALEELNGVRTVCIGNVTVEALRRYGCKVDIVAEEYTANGMAAAIVRDSGGDK